MKLWASPLNPLIKMAVNCRPGLALYLNGVMVISTVWLIKLN